MPQPSRRISGIIPSGKDGWEIHFTAWQRRQSGEDILMLSAGDHDFDTPQETVEACIRHLREGHHHYTPLPGFPRLRQAMATISTRCTGVETSPDEVIATPGGQLALFAALQGVLDPGDHGIVVAPYYATYPGTFRAAGARFTEVEARADQGFQPDLDAIAAAIEPRTRVILINSPNNPTGAIYSRDSLEGLAEICRRHDLWLVSDEVYWSLTGTAEHLSPRTLPSMAERTLIVNSMSKSHGMTGWRIGWLTGPTDQIRLLTSLNLVTTYGLPDFVSRAAIEALEGDYGLAPIAAIYDTRRRAFLEAIAAYPEIVVRGSQGGIYAMLDITIATPDCEAFAWKLLETERIAVMPGASFGDAARGHVRVSLCQPEERLADAARRIGALVRNYTVG